MNNSLDQLPVNSSRVMPEKTLLPLISVMLVAELGFCQSLQALLKFYSLSSSWQFKLVGEAGSKKQAFSILVKQQPSLILIDWDLFQEQNEGIETVVRLNDFSENSKNGSKILVLSSQGEETSIFLAMQAGACGYILKENLSTQLHLAITAMLNSQVYLCPEIAARFFRIFHLYQGRSAQAHSVRPLHHLTESNSSNPYSLTNREREVLQLLVEGYRNEEIAKCLYVTVATVKAHLTTIFKKLGVNSRNRAIVRSLHLGIV